jgi:uncharacterized protein YaaN involved in tellurite resistance
MTESLVRQPESSSAGPETLSPEDLREAKAIADSMDFSDSQAVVTFGAGAQKEVADFADSILSEVRARDTGDVGELLTDLVVRIKGVRADRLSASPSFWSRIPLLGALSDGIRRFILRAEKLSVQIDRIVDELDRARLALLKDISLLDGLYENNLQTLHSLDLHIAAGRLKIREIRERALPEAEAKAKRSQDPADAQAYQDFVQKLNRFDKKIHDLLLSRAVALQAAPQIRLIQNGSQALVEKIQSSILNTIPLWKNQVVIAITLFRQSKALSLQRKVSQTTQELLVRNAEMLKQNTAGVSREAERGIVDIETLQKVNRDLIATIEETLLIQREGRIKRQAAEKELVKIEGELKTRLLSAEPA